MNTLQLKLARTEMARRVADAHWRNQRRGLETRPRPRPPFFTRPRS